MPTGKIPHLCGGILFGLLLEARRARRKARNKLKGGTDHLSAVDVYAGLIQVVTGDDISAAGRTISKACTLYKTCQTGSGVYVPFTERVTIAAFDAAVKTKNPDLLMRMSEFISSYLNLERCEWLVRALIETIHMDEDIQENEEFLIDYDTVVCADDLPYVSNVVLEPFLISVLHYILLNSPDAESGRATFESWYTQSSKNAEWKLQSDIGSSISPLRVYSRMPEVGGATSAEDSTEERMGAAIITNRADTVPDLALYKDGIFLLEEGIVDPSEDGVETDNEDIRLYLEKIGQKYGTVRTLLNPYQQTPVRNIYVCNDIVRNILVPGRVRNTYAVKFIHNASAQDLAACSNFVIIIGTGGIGKSMMIRHLLLDAIEHYSEDGIVPIFLMLKDYDVNVDWDNMQRVSEQNLSIRDLNKRLFLPQRDEAVISELKKTMREVDNPRVAIFSPSIEHSNRFADMLSAAGIPCAALSKVDKAERRRRLLAFASGTYRAVCAVDVMNEGIDIPDVNILVFLRATHSRRIFVQQLGRGLRLSEGKEKVIVLDFVSDIRRMAEMIEMNNEGKAKGAEHEVVYLREGFVSFSDARVESFVNVWLEDVADLSGSDDEVKLKFPEGF